MGRRISIEIFDRSWVPAILDQLAIGKGRENPTELWNCETLQQLKALQRSTVFAKNAILFIPSSDDLRYGRANTFDCNVDLKMV